MPRLPASDAATYKISGAIERQPLRASEAAKEDRTSPAGVIL